MDTVTLSAPDPDELGVAIRAAQAQLEKAVIEGNLSNDPLRLPLAAMAMSLGAQLKLFNAHFEQLQNASRRLDGHAASIKAISFDPKQLKVLEEAAVTGANRAARQFASAHNWRTLGILAGVLLGCVTLAALGGWWLGWQEGVDRFRFADTGLAEITSSNPALAAQWVNLMRWNNFDNLMDSCRGDRVAVDNPTGRRACALPLWIEPPKSGSAP